jgi:hypothetical protein
MCKDFFGENGELYGIFDGVFGTPGLTDRKRLPYDLSDLHPPSTHAASTRP